MTQTNASAARVQQALQELGLETHIKDLPQSTRTAVKAADAVGCQVSQIVKSLVFKTRSSGRAVLILTSGANRVDEQSVAAVIGEALTMADPDFVRQRTGFAIGGVAPVGLIDPIPTFIDQDLLKEDQIWAAAGTPYSVFRLTPQELVQATGGKIISVQPSTSNG